MVAQVLGHPPGDPALPNRLAEVAQGIASALEEARRIARHLGPVEPGASALKAAITALAAEVSAAGKLRCFPELDGCEGTLSAAQKVRIYRLVEAGIGNVIAHGHASLVMIRIQSETRHLRIQLEDDRLGLDPANTESELIHAAGLERFRQRVLLLGGQFSVSVAPCGGARVCVQLPLESADG
jgi:signal transduction histidine kinase